MTEELTPFSQNDYEISEREILYQGTYRYARYHVRTRKFNGEWTPVYKREVLERPAAVAILPYDPILDQVVLIEEFRIGAISNPQSPWLLEIVAGLQKPSEKPEEVVRREAQEEAGCEILDIYPICEYFVTPGVCTEFIKIYCGRIDASETGGIHGLADEHEDIRAFSLSTEEAFTLVQEGKIKTSPAIIALQWLQLNREWLKQLWQTK